MIHQYTRYNLYDGFYNFCNNICKRFAEILHISKISSSIIVIILHFNVLFRIYRSVYKIESHFFVDLFHFEVVRGV